MNEGDDDALARELASAVEEARGLGDRKEAGLRLERLADLCAQVPGPKMADALLLILDDDDPQVRVAAGEALLDVGYERYAEVARAVERLLDSGKSGPALTEVPFVLAEIGEPSALPLLRRFVTHASPEVVASGVEAMAQLGDPEAIADLKKLLTDEREVSVEDLEDGGATIGELAEDAIAELGGDEDE